MEIDRLLIYMEIDRLLIYMEVYMEVKTDIYSKFNQYFV